jgi:hypothetical protein
MSRILVPKPYQELASKFLYDHPRCSLWAGMGMGKTVSSLLALDMLRLTGMLDAPVLILGPLRVARNTWPNETKKWAQYEGLRIVPIVGDLDARRAALNTPATIYSVNYEQLPWLIDYMGDRWPFRIVIADEATRLKGFRINKGGERVKALSKVAHAKVDRWINLTGTPAPNGLKDLWGQQWFVDRGKALGLTYSGFMQRWFQRSWSGHGVDPLPHADPEMKRLLADSCLTLDPNDWFDLKKPRHVPLKFALPAKARKAYTELERAMFTELESGTNVEVFAAGSLSNKCAQLANGAVYTTYPAWEEVHAVKLDLLKSVVEEAGGMPVLVSYAFKSDRDRILKTFGKDGVDISTEKGLAAFSSGHVAVGVAHPASMGHGIDGLQDVTCKLVRFGRTWDLELEQQIFERIGPVRQAQSGHQRVVDVYDLIAEDTVDEAIVARHVTKRSVQDSLLDYMNPRKQ